VSAVPMRARNAERALIGQQVTEAVIDAAGTAAGAECDPSPDLRGSIDYKRDITRVLTKRAIRAAIQRVQ
ncbi:MAG: xanthine dehydrogenase family protein subunit M, partial [Anaerolineae bacterium]|nr:xanthine dehydrogenase family protein subunit M [Anaerolineae bacterium]